MGEFIALGMTHYPAFLSADDRMADMLRWTMEDEAIPAAAKNPESWPEAMQTEYADDGGTAAAARHRAVSVENFRRLRQELDDFQPDAVLIWGDDQYENFREETIPPFCVFALDDQELKPWSHVQKPNVWNEPTDHVWKMGGAKQIAKELASSVLEQQIDLSYAYKLRDSESLPHAFMNSLMFLDYERTGFPYPVIPFQINCYGSYVICRHGMPARIGVGQDPGDIDPPGPTPQRAMAVGAAVARAIVESPYRIAVIGSSSWSHAFLTDKTWRLYPDLDSDQRYYDAMTTGDYDYWSRATSKGLEESGQQEMLNWFALIGAVQAGGQSLAWSDFSATHAFNSTKVFACFK